MIDPATSHDPRRSGFCLCCLAAALTALPLLVGAGSRRPPEITPNRSRQVGRPLVQGVLDQGQQFLAVPFPPRPGVPAEQAAQGFMPGPAPSRATPARVIRRRSASAPASAAEPGGVIWYGRRRSSPPSGSMSPRSTSRVIAPYRAPGPEPHPGEVLDVLGQRVPVLRPLRQADQDQQRRIIRPAQPARCHAPFLLRPT